MLEADQVIQSLEFGLANNFYSRPGTPSLIHFIKTAHKIKLEISPPDECIYFATECINNGIFHLPYQSTFLVWKEADNKAGESAALVIEYEGGLNIFAFSKVPNAARSPLPNFWWSFDVDFGVPLKGHEKFSDHVCGTIYHPAGKRIEDQMERYPAFIEPRSPFWGANQVFDDAARERGQTTLEIRQQDTRHFFEQIRGIVVLLKSQSVEVRDVKPSRQQLRAAQRRNELPPFEYKIARINLSAIRDKRLRDDIAEKRSPRMHWRRGHIRRLHTGGLTSVSPCIVGRASSGIIQKEYIVCNDA